MIHIISLKYKDVKIKDNSNLKLMTGLNMNPKEKNGNGFDDANIDSSDNFPNELYLKIKLEYIFKFNEKLEGELGYSIELVNVDS